MPAVGHRKILLFLVILAVILVQFTYPIITLIFFSPEALVFAFGLTFTILVSALSVTAVLLAAGFALFRMNRIFRSLFHRPPEQILREPMQLGTHLLVSAALSGLFYFLAFFSLDLLSQIIPQIRAFQETLREVLNTFLIQEGLFQRPAPSFFSEIILIIASFAVLGPAVLFTIRLSISKNPDAGRGTSRFLSLLILVAVIALFYFVLSESRPAQLEGFLDPSVPVLAIAGLLFRLFIYWILPPSLVVSLIGLVVERYRTQSKGGDTKPKTLYPGFSKKSIEGWDRSAEFTPFDLMS